MYDEVFGEGKKTSDRYNQIQHIKFIQLIEIVQLDRWSMTLWILDFDLLLVNRVEEEFFTQAFSELEWKSQQKLSLLVHYFYSETNKINAFIPQL